MVIQVTIVDKIHKGAVNRRNDIAAAMGVKIGHMTLLIVAKNCNISKFQYDDSVNDMQQCLTAHTSMSLLAVQTLAKGPTNKSKRIKL